MLRLKYLSQKNTMELKLQNIPEFEPQKLNLPDPAFLTYQPQFPKMIGLRKELGHYKNILVIGHGGSVTSLMGFYGALGSEKNIQFLSTVDPEYISKLKVKLSKEDTLVIAISKSGETVTQIEALMQFIDYPLLAITGKDSVLYQIAEKVNAKILLHPIVGGRYTAFTEVGLAPAAIAGMDVEALYKGALEMYRKYHQDNIALKAAQAVYALEQKGIVDVFMPFYSHEVFAFQNLIVQLCHESFGKDGKGQTYFAHEAPESQHHTNQRFFGGRKNIAGFFVEVEHFKNDLVTNVPHGMQSIAIKDSSLFELHNMPLSFAMKSEFKGTWEDAKIHDIPILSLSLSSVNPHEIGAFAAFWQLYAVYSSILRGVDPFDQPQVESSKNISWTKRKDFKRI